MSHAYRGGGGDRGGDSAGRPMGTAPGAVCAYMAGADRFCARANTPHNYGEINRCIKALGFDWSARLARSMQGKGPCLALRPTAGGGNGSCGPAQLCHTCQSSAIHCVWGCGDAGAAGATL